MECAFGLYTPGRQHAARSPACVLCNKEVSWRSLRSDLRLVERSRHGERGAASPERVYRPEVSLLGNGLVEPSAAQEAQAETPCPPKRSVGRKQVIWPLVPLT